MRKMLIISAPGAGQSERVNAVAPLREGVMSDADLAGADMSNAEAARPIGSRERGFNHADHTPVRRPDAAQ